MKTKLLVNLSLMAVVIVGVLGLLACTMPYDTTPSSSSSKTSTQVTTTRSGVQTGFLFVVNRGGDSLSVFSIEPATGELSPVGQPIDEPNRPTWVSVDPVGPFVYVTNNGGTTGSVSAYTLNETTGTLTSAGAPVPAGGGPLGVAVYPGHNVYAVNNMRSVDSVAAYTINPTNGTLNALTGSPFDAQAWPGGIAVYLGGKYAYVTNFDSSSISAYKINSSEGSLSPIKSTLEASSFPAQYGPRHVAIYEPGPFLYVANGGAVSAYAINGGTGALAPAGPSLAESTYQSGSGNFAYDVAVCTGYGYVYVSNSNENTITAYTIDKSSGTLTPIRGTTASSTFSAGTTPRGLSIYEPGPYLYVSNSGEATVSAYAIDPASGAITPVTGLLDTSSYTTGQTPYGVAAFSSVTLAQ